MADNSARSSAAAHDSFGTTNTQGSSNSDSEDEDNSDVSLIIGSDNENHDSDEEVSDILLDSDKQDCSSFTASDTEDLPQLFRNDVELPILLKVDLEAGMEEIAHLLRNPPEDYLCKKVPVKCEFKCYVSDIYEGSESS